MKKIITSIGVLIVIVFFSYPAAFSYDIFNYVFTAKTVLLYMDNPYIVKPLDYQGIDPMLSFMRWTHLPTAYTPLWILLTIPMYLLSFGVLPIATWLMKVPSFSFYVLTIVVIYKILKTMKVKNPVFGLVVFAFNPLVIIEVLVSAHNDVLMMGFALLSFLFFLQRKRYLSFFFLSLSIATKFITIFLSPLVVTGWTVKKSVLLMVIALTVVVTRRELLGWYLLWVIPFMALLPYNRSVLVTIIGISMSYVFKYTPLFYFGLESYVPLYQRYVVIAGLALTLVFILVSYGVKTLRDR